MKFLLFLPSPNTLLRSRIIRTTPVKQAPLGTNKHSLPGHIFIPHIQSNSIHCIIQNLKNENTTKYHIPFGKTFNKVPFCYCLFLLPLLPLLLLILLLLIFFRFPPLLIQYSLEPFLEAHILLEGEVLDKVWVIVQVCGHGG